MLGKNRQGDSLTKEASDFLKKVKDAKAETKEKLDNLQ